MLILMALRDAGMTAKDVTLVPAGGVGANLSAVVNGAVDTAMTGASRSTTRIPTRCSLCFGYAT